MISTITTSTVSSVTIAGSFAVIGILLLMGLLIQKEMVSTGSSERAKRFRKVLNIGIYPLLVVFILFIISKVIAIIP